MLSMTSAQPLVTALDEAGYATPTPIQQKAIPVLLSGHDLIGIAQTGTGKTLAYLLPIFQALETTDHVGPSAVVICPTRELAIQVAGEADKFGKHLGVRTVLAYGGTSSGSQKQAKSSSVQKLRLPKRRRARWRTAALFQRRGGYWWAILCCCTGRERRPWSKEVSGLSKS